jgi:para-aminobenzoate synthetase component 1
MLCSFPGSPGVPGHERARWSFLAEPTQIVTIGPNETDPLERLAAEIDSTGRKCIDGGPIPFAGGWLVALSYDLGASIEPAVGPVRAASDWPWSIVMWRCPNPLAFDHANRVWWEVGSKEGASEIDPNSADWSSDHPDARLGPIAPTIRREAFERAVARAVEYTHAGDVFQVNLSHELEASFEGSARSLFARLAAAGSPWFGAYLESPRGDSMHAALSLSPELFLDVDAASRIVTTRPIKGTRRGSDDPGSLRDSAKDQAELHMIVDLMRNDLGRVCETGSVHVAGVRDIERHGGEHGSVHHGVATVRGVLRDGTSAADLLRATFPAGSITGAPKIRAMQIIRELEGRARGLYTGAIGFISDSGNISLNVAIRTAVISGRRAGPDEIIDGQLRFGAGAGIVADSIPSHEWQETLDKARVITDAPTVSPTPVVMPLTAQGARA